ncbi:MAG: DUF6390 family protein [Candidatus ainarchaeum sp.]|nr:DUF6390 family protein [Candidatus ainarchaeum sp.]
MPQQNETSALQFACRYSLVPNELGYCGKEKAFLEFGKFLKNPEEKKIPEIKNLLGSFFGLHSYLDLIARANNKNVFDPEVLEAYWLGNRLLENVPRAGISRAILHLEKYGLPEKIAEQKAISLPEGALPHHSLHVLHVNFVTRKLRPLVRNLSDCLIQWAEVRAVSNGKLRVKGIELKALNKKFVLQEKTKTIENQFSLLPEKGDFVSVHWKNAIEILSKEQLKNLQKTTMKNIGLANPEN